jgi:hypothetical protein
MHRKVGIIVGLAVVLAIPPVLAQKAGSSTRVTTGVVKKAEQVELASEAGKGAVVGGSLGLLSAGGKSSSKKARNTLIGGLAGAGLSSRAQGSRKGMAYTVEPVSGGSMRVVTDQTEIKVGDCVTVEEVKDTANVRRVSSTQCEPASKAAREDLKGELHEEAEECAAAKQELVGSSTAEQLDLAKRKMDILCSD